MATAKRSLLIWICLTICTASTYSQAELDTSFNGTGKQTTTGGFTYGTLVQQDRKIILFGRSSDGGGAFGAVRYNEDGSLDGSFGNGGIVVTDLEPGLNDTAFGGAIQSDGKIVLVGVTSFNIIGLGNFALVRYNADGTLDKSFGSGGKTVSDLEVNDEDVAKSVSIQPDGKIVVAGRTYEPGNPTEIVARYDSSGNLDPTFGNGGVVKTLISGHAAWGESVALQPDGKILVGGGMCTVPAPPDSTYSYTLTRYNSNGTVDGFFGAGGRVTIVHGLGGDSNTHIRSIAVQPDGRILAAGGEAFYFVSTPTVQPTSPLITMAVYSRCSAEATQEA